MLRTYDPDIFEVFVDDAEGATERVVTAEEIAAVDARIKAAVSGGGTYADALARHDDESGVPVDPLLRKQTEGPMKDDAGQMVDKVLKHFDDALKMHCDAINKRMDAIEAEYKKDRAGRKKDSHFDEGEEGEESERERELGREKRDGDLTLKHEGRDKDEDEPSGTPVEKEKAREVAAHADNEPADGQTCALFRVAFDDAMSGLGMQTPKVMAGESFRAYRLRVLNSVKRHSPGFAKVDLRDIRGPAMEAITKQILADTVKAAERGPDDVPPGQLREIIKIDPTTGRRMSLFYGPNTFIMSMKRPARHIKSFWPHGASTTAAS
jgi:hypothetical protein